MKQLVLRSHNEYEDVLLKKKCLRHSTNRIQSKDHRIGTYEIKKISLGLALMKKYHPKQWMK